MVMPYRRIYFEKNQPLHIISRALVDIFKQGNDCYKFVFQFYTANLGKRNSGVRSADAIKAGKVLLEGEKIPSKFLIKEHSPFVFLLDFALVGNHYHFYLLPQIDNAIPALIQKLNNGFAQSFNLLHDRKDAVFGSRYKAVIVKTDLQADAVSRYVSIINPLDMFQPGWRENGLKNWKESFNFLENYQFSSFPDKIGKRNSLILAPKEILEQYSSFWKNREEYQKFVKEFLKEKSVSSRSVFIE